MRLNAVLTSPTQAFYRESLLWKGLDHEHILEFLGVSDIFEDTVCMVIPWMENGNLREYMVSQRKQGNLRDEKFVAAVDQWVSRSSMVLCYSRRSKLRVCQVYEVALGLEYLHSEGVVHGDLHGGNILVKETGSICLCDFGMALVAESTPYSNNSFHGGGAIHWQAPELFDPEMFNLESRRPSTNSDVFSFASTSFEVLLFRFRNLLTLDHT